MKVLIAGGGIGGLTLALMLGRRGIDAEVFEQASEIKELGVGINTLPHAVKELAELGLLPALERAGVRTRELVYQNRFGQDIWREPRGMDAGFDIPQFSIHRGRLQALIHRAAAAEIGESRIRTGCRLGSFVQDEGGVRAWFFDREGRHVRTAHGDVIVGADGIHSLVRQGVAPAEGPPSWNGIMLWRGAAEWPTFLDGRTMIVAGGLDAKAVIYPIAEGGRADTRLTNWAVAVRLGDGSAPPPRREDWSRRGSLEDLIPHARRFAIGEVDLQALILQTAEFFEYPMCDRDPLPRWTEGRSTLLGDAAHPMYPVGSNGASQAILDARCLADHLVAADTPQSALLAYERERLPATAEIVRLNRRGGPEGVIDAIERLAPDGFSDINEVMSFEQRKAIVGGYAGVAGFTPERVNKIRAA